MCLLSLFHLGCAISQNEKLVYDEQNLSRIPYLKSNIWNDNLKSIFAVKHEKFVLSVWNFNSVCINIFSLDEKK